MGNQYTRFMTQNAVTKAILDESVSEDEARRVWMENLPLTELQSMAHDYQMGSRDPADVDAYQELCRRFPNRGRRVDEGVKLARCDMHRKGRRPSYCELCNALEEQRSQSVSEASSQAIADDDSREGSQAITDAPDALPDNSHADSIDDAQRKEKLEAFHITKAEQIVLKELPSRQTCIRMAEKLFLSPHTVKSHTKSIYRKLGVNTHAEAVRVAAEHGLI